MREWEAYYSEDGKRRQKAFWDRYLKGIANEVDEWKPLEFESRIDLGKSVKHFDVDWPPAAARLADFKLGDGGRLMTGMDSAPATATHVSFASHRDDSRVQWEHTFKSRTEISGNGSLKLYVQAMHSPDAHLCVAVQKITRDGKEAKWYIHSQTTEASAMHGWLRVSHGEKDEKAIHSHQKRLWLQPHVVYEVEIELWPTSTIWEEGETLRLVVKGTSFFDDEQQTITKKFGSHSFGEVRVWFGGEYDSDLLLPVMHV
ncbi:hypothetical protein LCI18_003548 [Fusarium solani-melongenae]|uniref:Uncharacterized protein n=1 Tax=Fusarium solani subsp. cucurbitae TaxID=2747967 RepID=A0ACD3YXM2_FUSSC|nr:hypothetical protein LCI18_003548 [Fusarium solani-melongenae]